MVQGLAVADPRDPRLPHAFAQYEQVVSGVALERAIATFLSPGHSYADAYDNDSLARLQAVKTEVDPLGRIIGNREIGGDI